MSNEVKPNTKFQFLQLSQKECLEIYPSLIESYQRHFNTAKHIAEIEDYGNAIAHLILSTEELIKGLVLFLDGKGYRFRSIKRAQQLFSDHKSRHGIAFVAYIAGYGLTQIIKFQEDYKKYKENSQSITIENEGIKLIMDVLTKREKGEAQFDEQTVIEIIDKNFDNFIKMKNMFDKSHSWWIKADTLKQQGFYVGYNSGIVSSDTITQNDYLQALNSVEQSNNYILTIFNIFKELPDELMKKIVQDFYDKKYTLLTVGLSQFISDESIKALFNEYADYDIPMYMDNLINKWSSRR